MEYKNKINIVNKIKKILKLLYLYITYFNNIKGFNDLSLILLNNIKSLLDIEYNNKISLILHINSDRKLLLALLQNINAFIKNYNLYEIPKSNYYYILNPENTITKILIYKNKISEINNLNKTFIYYTRSIEIMNLYKKKLNKTFIFYIRYIEIVNLYIKKLFNFFELNQKKKNHIEDTNINNNADKNDCCT
jgi:hypothetical protein